MVSEGDSVGSRGKEKHKVHREAIGAWCKRERFFLLGMAILIALSTMFVVAGEGIPAFIHDSFDIEVSRIVVQLKHPNSNSLPELMDGAWSVLSSLSPDSLVFYMGLDPVEAFVVNTVFVLFVA